MNKTQKLRFWWIPQIPGESFYYDVESVEDGVKLLDAFAKYDLFQLENKIKPDYANAGGLQMFDEEDDTDSPEGSWVEWEIEYEGQWFFDPEEYIEVKSKQNSKIFDT